MKLRTVLATRYVTPLREGGSLPAIVEADDDGLYVLKFRGAGQGPKALIAELLAGELARVLELPVPELVFIDVDPELARTEPDSEIQQLIRASAGLNIGLDYLPAAVTLDPIAEKPDSALASAIVWFDAYVSNPDRTVRNANLLLWHGTPRLIDHGAALYFHHGWNGLTDHSKDSFPRVKDHILLPFASEVPQADEVLAARLSEQLIEEIVSLIPDSWLISQQPGSEPDELRRGYVRHLWRRLEAPRTFVEEAIRARTMLV